MVGANAHGRAMLFADLHQRNKAFPDAIDLFLISRIGIFNEFKFFLVGIVARVHPHFLNDAGSDLCGIGREMNIGHQWCMVTTLAQLILDVLQVECFIF